ncbi:MAG: squalene--hopene cyclase [Alphaproteobacteria bacterium]|nr:squalene--hopene cyclase [Alphaproteobacteria bacterium]
MFEDPTDGPARGERGRARSNLDAQIAGAIDQATGWLVERQKPEGYWVGRLETNGCMEAEWVLFLWFMGLDDHHLRPRLAAALRRMQAEDGSWRIYHGAPSGDINTTVEAYAALRSVGDDPAAPHMARAREWIASKGGLRNIRVFTRYWLALIGEWPWERTPNVPPEVVRFPNWFPFSIYNFAQWARATLMPITLLSARRPSRPLPADRRLDELFPGGREAFDYSLPKKAGADAWDRFFRGADRALHALQGLGASAGVSLMREGSAKLVREWIIQHQDADGVWGGIQPPWIYSLMALRSEGYPLEHAVLERGIKALDDPRWRLDIDDATWIQASTSPVWDTVLTLLAFEDTHEDGHEGGEATKPETANQRAIDRAIDWVLDQQVLVPGDWKVKAPKLEPGGWAFEYANNFYPDTDDTAVALIALAPLRDERGARGERIDRAIRLGVGWLLGMQSKTGGWGAFDKDNNKQILTKIPFCDFGEALDPPSVDVTAHIVEALGKLGYTPRHPAVERALNYLKAEQEPNGAWFGRWGVNYVYGTGAVLPALEAIGEDMSQPYVKRASDWLVSVQNDDGGWGETCASYMDPDLIGKGVSTASQTAWALMGLVAAGRPEDEKPIIDGLQFLIDRQNADGTWDEPHYTGTGFPGYGVGQTIKLTDPMLKERLQQGAELSRAFMINYHLYRHYFPMMAFGRARKLLAKFAG